MSRQAGPKQQKLPDRIVEALTSGCRALEAGDERVALEPFERALALARELGDL